MYAIGIRENMKLQVEANYFFSIPSLHGSAILCLMFDVTCYFGVQNEGVTVKPTWLPSDLHHMTMYILKPLK